MQRRNGVARARNDSCGEHQSGFRYHSGPKLSWQIGWSEADFPTWAKM
eukprot:COSAG04_NODE_11266_length_720_cov_0.882448_2_plen_47_part_01